MTTLINYLHTPLTILVIVAIPLAIYYAGLYTYLVVKSFKQ